jgi:hypothetical protein
MRAFEALTDTSTRTSVAGERRPSPTPTQSQIDHDVAWCKLCNQVTRCVWEVSHRGALTNDTNINRQNWDEISRAWCSPSGQYRRRVFLVKRRGVQSCF